MNLRTLALAAAAFLPLHAQTLSSFTLIDASTDQPIAAHDPLVDGATVDTSVTGTALSIRANTTPNPTGSVVFALGGSTTRNQTESAAPYALFGDSSGDYNGGSLNNGAHSLTATPYTQSGGNGTAGTPLTIGFTVIDGPSPGFSVDAGPDRSLLLPADSITLNATTANGTPQSFAWSQISGPSTATLSGETTADLTASDLVEGSYVFEVTATSTTSDSDSDQATVTVLPQGSATVTLSGELKKWHLVTLECPGPATSENDPTNPFADYRLDATFTHPASGKSYLVPGFYAADGDAAESSATSGNQWQVRFRPDETGTWNYALSFRTATDVAIDADPGAGVSAGFFDGATDSFVIAASDKSSPDLRAKGRLAYVGEHHLQFAETGEWFMKCGTDAPENLLAYDDFDDTPNDQKHNGNNRKSWSPHAGDYDALSMSSFTWQGGKGSELLGAIGYLASEGLNAFSFLTFSLDGDDDNVFPHLLTTSVADYEAAADNSRWNGGQVHKDRFDVSKMEQWERIFRYGSTQGMFLHLKTQETENDDRMDGGTLGRERILYYRELLARFGHHLALNWNIGEENTNSDAVRKQIAAWFAANDPYGHPVVLHTYPGQKNSVYTPLLGANSEYHGTSLQTNNATFTNVFSDTLDWVQNSANAGKKWIIACDEPGDAQHALRPDNSYDADNIGGPDNDAGNSHIDGRKNALWGNALAGGAGVEWYFGYGHAHSDLTCQDFRSRDQFWDVCRHFLTFWQTSGAPFREMSNANSLVSGAGNNANRCLAKPGEHYVVQLYDGDSSGSVTLDLSAATVDFDVRWFDPRNGGFANGSVTTVSGGSVVNLGTAPDSPTEDWIVQLSPAETVCRILFIRGADRSGGFLEAGNDTQRTEQLADINNASTSGGNHGWNSLRLALEGAGYFVDQITETAENASGPSQGIAIDFTSFDLDAWDLLVFGSNNAAYSTASIDAVETWIRERGGAALFISDANFGGSWKDAPDSDEPFLERFGLVVNQDQGTYALERASGHFAAPNHPVLTGIDKFDGEGVSPFVLNELPVPAGTTITKLADARNSTRNNDGTNPGNNFQGSSRSVTANDASLVAVQAGHGRVIGHFDRNTFFNLNGAGTDITRFDNEALALNLAAWLTHKLDPISAFEGWQQTWFAGLPGGRDDPQAAFEFDFNRDGLANGIHYALGSDPTSFSSGPTIENDTFGFHVEGSIPDDVTLVIQCSDVLSGWQDLAEKLPGQPWTGPVSEVPEGNGTRIQVPLSGDPAKFYRLVVTLP